MIYLTVFVSEIPVLPVLTPDQFVYIRAEQSVPDEFKAYPGEKASEYLKALAEVILYDTTGVKLPVFDPVPEVKSTPPPASEDETPSSAESQAS